MKNILFELYKPDQLAQFLKFMKERPDEKFVYVLQHPPQNINILSASDFGYLVICLPENSQLLYSPAPFIRKMKKNLQDFKPRDFILCTGDPSLIGLSTSIVSDITGGVYNMLKWDRQERRYYPLTIDLYGKIKIEDSEQWSLESEGKHRDTGGRMAMSQGGMVGAAISRFETPVFNAKGRRIDKTIEQINKKLIEDEYNDNTNDS